MRSPDKIPTPITPEPGEIAALSFDVVALYHRRRDNNALYCMGTSALVRYSHISQCNRYVCAYANITIRPLIKKNILDSRWIIFKVCVVFKTL